MEVFQIVDKIVQLCKEESGAVYLVVMSLLVVANFLPIGSWVKGIFSQQEDGSNSSERPMNQYVFPNSENPTFIENLNLMLPPEQKTKEEQNDE